ncbi:MAG TPA: hypothetical protein VIY09_03400 [Rhizomicrobium sp.]
MPLPPALDWAIGILSIVWMLRPLVKSIRMRLSVSVKPLTPEGETTPEPPEPKISFTPQIKIERRKPICFGTRTQPPV